MKRETATCGSVFISKIWKLQASGPSQNSRVSATEAVSMLLAASFALQCQPCGPHCPDIPLPPNTGIFWVCSLIPLSVTVMPPGSPSLPLFPGPPSRYALCSVFPRALFFFHHCPFPGTKHEPRAALQSQRHPHCAASWLAAPFLQRPKIKSVCVSTLSENTQNHELRGKIYTADFINFVQFLNSWFPQP